ncbi:alpha/beta fold hydrolase [Dyadobacter psychrotolerans]|uniref:Alpha/beta hydrolase n=1 Tax=Dyadobacter psychrotolerans TaxID=2541721 RepID=A0A4R5DG18_9BACT|nr:alpha/beta hydrolase [Dyadobacter psychrotolerans]TDE10744.1 alpha/beta hydrolase [Dyadobacter psychrotolerans]
MNRILRLTSQVAITLLSLTLLQHCKSTGENKIESVPDSSSSHQVIKAVDAKTEFAEINNKKIAYRSVGSGTPLILCTRYRAVLDDWDPLFIDELAKTFQVITFDYIGVGLSPGELSTDFAVISDDIKDLAAFLKLNKFAIGGWSYGGMIAQVCSVLYPDLVTHTVLIGTSPPGKPVKATADLFMEVSSKPVYELKDETVLFFEPTSALSRATAERSRQRIQQRTTDRDVAVPEKVWSRYFLGIGEYIKDKTGTLEKLKDLKTPILVVSGTRDIACPAENWFALNGQIPSLQLIVVPQAGHGPQHQYPQLVAQYISDFVKRPILE